MRIIDLLKKEIEGKKCKFEIGYNEESEPIFKIAKIEKVDLAYDWGWIGIKLDAENVGRFLLELDTDFEVIS